MITKRITFKNKDGHDISGILRIPDEEGKHPVVILCHGFLLHKEHFLMSDLANGLSHYGFLTLRFDFLSHGESGGGLREITLSQQVRDIREAVDYLKQHPNVDTKKIILLGHDLGGAACLLTDKGEVDGIVLLNVRTDLRAFIHSYVNDLDVKEWLSSGKIDLNGTWLHKDFYVDLVKHDVINAIKDEVVPILVAQSLDDKRVPIYDARRLLLTNPNVKIEEFPGADHNFDVPSDREKLVSVVGDWVKYVVKGR